MQAVVIGGGIVGLASAYYLAQREVSVVVCEKGNVGGGSTERAAGGIRGQFSTPVNVELSVESMQVWDTFEEAFDQEIEYRRNGYLFLARSEETAAGFRENVEMQNEHGVPSVYLDARDAREHCGGIDAEQFIGATYSPTDGVADPHLALEGFKRAAVDAGVDLRTKTPVTGVTTEDGRATSVQTDDGTIQADVVVNAAGPWAGRIAAMVDIDIPVHPKRRQIAVVGPDNPVPEDDPLTIDLDTGSYFRPERDGNALVGGVFPGPDPDQDPDTYSTTLDIDWAATAVEKAAKWTTYFGPESRIRRGWAGLYAVTPDHHPIIEETIPGFINAVGFSGHGFQHAPATGQLVTEIAVDGAPSLVDISALSSDRFESGDLLVEENVA